MSYKDLCWYFYSPGELSSRIPCCCGLTNLNSRSKFSKHICSGPLLDHWQKDRIQFPRIEKMNIVGRQYVGMILPKFSSSSADNYAKDVLAPIVKHRVKAAKFSPCVRSKSRLPLNVDVNIFSPRITTKGCVPTTKLFCPTLAENKNLVSEDTVRNVCVVIWDM